MQTNLIFFDVDGTIITEDNYIPESAIRAIHAAQEKGNLCIVNTGRPYLHLVPSVRDIGFSGYICSCGQHIVLNSETLLHDGFDAEKSAEIVRMVRACNVEAVFESEKGVWFISGEHPCPQMQESRRHFTELGFETENFVDKAGFQFDKFCIWPSETSDLERFIGFIEPLCEIIYRENNLIEFVKKGHSKQTGIAFLIDRLGIPLEHCYAIGDSTNDLPMFQCVKNSIAMGNAPDEVKQQVFYVTKPILEDGIADALKHFKLC